MGWRECISRRTISKLSVKRPSRLRHVECEDWDRSRPAGTSGAGLGRINLNILINFAFVRLLLPEVERRAHPWTIALLAMAIVLLIRPFQQILEYGAEGWLWALFGLSHRLALEAQHPHSRWTRDDVSFVRVSDLGPKDKHGLLRRVFGAAHDSVDPGERERVDLVTQGGETDRVQFQLLHPRGASD